MAAAFAVTGKHQSEAISLGTFPSVQGSGNNIHVTTDICGDF